MPSEYDVQLLESVAVRRRRLRQALLHGSHRGRRQSGDNVAAVAAGLVVAAVLSAGCVGWSFVEDRVRAAQSSEVR